MSGGTSGPMKGQRFTKDGEPYIYDGERWVAAPEGIDRERLALALEAVFAVYQGAEAPNTLARFDAKLIADAYEKQPCPPAAAACGATSGTIFASRMARRSWLS